MANEYFFPPIEPFETGTLKVSAPHELYWEQCGNPGGEPIVFLHGGPGAGCSEQDRVISPDSGHSSHEPGITRELVASTNRIVKTGSPCRA